jgi:transglutaminase-like putative cysteine protease
MIHQEKELNQQIYNGSVQALALLSDVRVGDVIDYAYTINGNNPVMGGRFATFISLAEDHPIQHLRFRLLWPGNRKLFMRSHNTDIQPQVKAADETEYLWDMHDIAALDPEDSIPSWFDPYPSVDLSEFESWNDVVNWALPLYRVDDAPSPELKATIDMIAKSNPNSGDRLLAAMRFVQDDVRYLGIEMGSYSHQPTQPAKVLARRFGDCKDKSLLLATMLKALGIDAAPALVNTASGKSLDLWQPSPYAFNHVIVQARLSGATYWLEATRSYQRGGLSQFYNPPFSMALVLREGTGKLEEIPITNLNSPLTVVQEHYKVDDYNSPVQFVVTTTFTGEAADNERYIVSKQSPEELGKQFLNYYAGDNPSIKANGLPLIADDEKANRIVVTEQYSIQDFWKDETHSLNADRIREELGKPDISKRTMPLKVSYPVNILQTMEVDFPDAPDVSDSSETIVDDAIRFESSVERNGNKIKLAYSLRTLRDHVTVTDVPKHLATVDKIRRNLGFEISPGSNSGSPIPATAVNWMSFLPLVAVVVLPVAVFASVYGARRVFLRRRTAEFKKKFVASPGDGPATAIRAASDEEMKSYLAKGSCRCGRPQYSSSAELEQESITYDTERLTVVRLRCDGCGATRDVYFIRSRPQQTGDAIAVK